MRDCSEDCALHQHRKQHQARATAGPSRRDFVATTLFASVSAFLAACGDGNIGGVTGSVYRGAGNPPPPNGGSPLVVTLADFPALAADGGIARVDGGSAVPIAVTRVNATTYLAFSLICPHAGYRPLEFGEEGGFECPNHGAEFDSTGHWRGGRSTGDLDQYAVAYNGGNGTLSITSL